MFVDDSIYAKVYEKMRERIEQTVAAGIEAIFIFLCRLELSKCQDSVSFEKNGGNDGLILQQGLGPAH